ncbi:alpha/beta hydrolase [Iamia majanohamensis]|uniref:Alpha/beta hydrolase n=1 Tax=Iamia majanohamensis TaxID=467976 RepID=A0AAE9Y4X1_9ACTN|nr:alpha/beta hydrolase [Iamia majanohamensis]WCO66345.1 alpha/beta hydrolase [Iamia majanohamensis]
MSDQLVQPDDDATTPPAAPAPADEEAMDTTTSVDRDTSAGDSPDDGVAAPPGLPPGRMVDLAGRGPSWVRADDDAGGRTDVLVVHGWTVTADTTFAPSYPALADRYRVIAPDLRGHGRGLRTAGRVRLEDLADDLAQVLDGVGSDRAVVVGYSLGGAVAQLLWRRHPERVAGLVLCSTARNFQSGPVGDLWYRGQGWLAPAVRAWPGPARNRMVQAVNGKVSDGPYAEWYRRELLRSDPATLLRVGAALGRFRSNAWIGEVDVPAAVVITTEDRTVPTRRQRGLARALPDAAVHEVAGPHNSAVTQAAEWVPALRRALDGLELDPA